MSYAANRNTTSHNADILFETAGSIDWNIGETDASELITGSDFHINSGSATTRLAITSSGNVGIGTTAPQSKLHIQAGEVQVGQQRGELRFGQCGGDTV